MSKTTEVFSPFAEKLLKAFQRLTKECVPHPCGGFNTDDLEWRMGIAFTPEEDMGEAMDELLKARIIRFAGFDENSAIESCYELI